MIVALAFYLYDSTLFLRANEAVAVQGRRGRWSIRFGSDRVRLARREPFFPNPLLPGRALRRASWNFEAAPPPATAAAAELEVPAAISRQAPFAVFGAVCLFAWLPLALFVVHGFWFTVAAFLALYLNGVVAMAMLFVGRSSIGLQGQAFWTLAFECVVCPLFTINIVRRLSLRMPMLEHIDAVAPAVCEGAALAEVRRQMLARIDEQICAEAEGSLRMQRLQDRADAFNGALKTACETGEAA